MGTPEGVVLEYPLAGIGSRFIAGAADAFVQLCLIGLALFVLALHRAGMGGR